jgi:hypothetical protein
MRGRDAPRQVVVTLGAEYAPNGKPQMAQRLYVNSEGAILPVWNHCVLMRQVQSSLSGCMSNRNPFSPKELLVGRQRTSLLVGWSWLWLSIVQLHVIGVFIEVLQQKLLCTLSQWVSRYGLNM